MWSHVIVFTLLTLIVCGVSEDTTCLADDDNPYLQFATRTNPQEIFHNWKTSFQVPGCEPARVWMVVRPGASWPGQLMARRMKNLHRLKGAILANHKKGKVKICDKDITNLELSQFPSQVEADYMETQGVEDLTKLGAMINDTFPKVFHVPYTETDYKIRYTKYINARQSVSALAQGMFGDEFDLQTLPEPLDSDHKLDFTHQCETWKVRVMGSCARDRGAFDRSQLMRALRKSVTERLGFKKTLSLADIVTMYIGCSLEKSMNPTAPPAWCAAFNTYELQLLEYREDLMYYRACGPGDDSLIVRRLSCPLVKDLLNKFQHREDEPRATVYVTDEKALLILLYGLGMADATLGLPEDMDHRGYRTATLAPFSANFLAVLYKCSRGDRLRVGFYLNGRPVDADEDGGPQPWGLVQRRLASYYLDSSECRLDVCGGSPRTGVYGPGAVAAGSTAITVLATTLATLAPVL